MDNFIVTKNSDFILRKANINDAYLIVEFIKKLGKYQKMEHAITSSPKQIKKLLKEKQGEAVFGIYKEEIISVIYFYEKSSAFTGYKGLYIDAFFIDNYFRKKGLGKIMFQYLSKYAIDKACDFLEWGCLDWNISAINFYEKLGAYCVDNMKIYRLPPQTLYQNAKKFESNN